MCLLSMTCLLQTYLDKESICTHDQMTLIGASRNPVCGPVCVFVNSLNNLPMGPADRYEPRLP
jgi:hypothetical protein